ncbi:MAG TPA: hypothetical protein VLF14_00665 [Candidatus Binatia bacterium]|nr:hypothetical protein [Candidatus Binatia bacterium]
MGSLEEVAEPAVSGLASSSSLLPASGLGQRVAEIGDGEEWCSTTRVAIEVATPRGENDQPLAGGRADEFGGESRARPAVRESRGVKPEERQRGAEQRGEGDGQAIEAHGW